MATQDDLRLIALKEFAVAGYAATSLQRIAELAGLSKSSVLYHFASKEALLEAAIGPAIDQMELIMSPVRQSLFNPDARHEFIERFVDFLLDYRLEVHMFINQGPGLEDVPVIDRANELVVQLSTVFDTSIGSTEDHLRFGVALGGAAYVLSAKQTFSLDAPPVEEIRSALVTIVTELLDPIAQSVASDH
jgi:AcrR family transcriptional regulator